MLFVAGPNTRITNQSRHLETKLLNDDIWKTVALIAEKFGNMTHFYPVYFIAVKIQNF